MEKTPLSLRKHIAIMGKTNAGKSSLFNGLLGQELAIVSPVKGTTTDPVTKAMELIPYGPVALIDTAGLSDDTVLGEKRMKKSYDILQRCDLVIYVREIFDEEALVDFGELPVVLVFTKCDLADENLLSKVRQTNPDAVFLSGYTDDDLKVLRAKLVNALKKQERDDETLLGNLVAKGKTVVLVVPIDEAAPKGRLILPQVQTIRDCLDHDIKAVCVKPEFLEETLKELPHTELVVTDSQEFAAVDKMVPKEIYLTSFSMLLANQKGRINQLVEGASAIKALKDGDKILMLEACTHSTTHEDIGRVKIPNLMKKITGKNLDFDYFSGYDMPQDLKSYSLIIHCGGCMINKKAIQSRLKAFAELQIPVTNYGVVLAYLSGILPRASKIFLDKEKSLG